MRPAVRRQQAADVTESTESQAPGLHDPEAGIVGTGGYARPCVVVTWFGH